MIRSLMSPESFVNCEPMIDAYEAGGLLKLHPKTVKRLAADGIIPGLKIGKLWRFRASSLDEWMRSQLHCTSHPRPLKENA